MSGPWDDYKSSAPAAMPWDEYAPKKEPAAVTAGKAINSFPLSRMDKFLRGIRDPLDGAAQMLEKALPTGLVNAGNTANNWIADKTGLLAKLPEGGLSASIGQQEKQYQAQRAAGGESGFDGYRLIGNVANPVNLAVAGKLPQAASMLGKLGVGALGGGGVAALNPVTDGDFWSEKGKQVALGAGFGAATAPLAGALSRVISPKASMNPNVAILKKEGVQPTIGQTLGGWVNRAEEKAQSLPIVGDAISAARQRANDQLNKAAFNRALAPIGETLPKNVPLGGSAVEYTSSKLGAAYDNILPKLTTQADGVFSGKVQSLQAMVNNGALDPKYAALFERTLKTRVLDKFQGQNSMSGQTLKDTESFLSSEIKRFGMSQDPDARLIGDAFKEVQSELRGLVIRTNPQYAAELKAINSGWANFKRVQRAASGLGADDGVFTSAQLQNAVKALDKSKDKARFAEGNALMQDLSGAAKSQMGDKVSDSGTAGRLLLGTGALASGALNPAIPAGLLGGAAAYTPQVQALMRSLVSSRPQSAQSIADAIRQSSPYFALPGAQVGVGLLE